MASKPKSNWAAAALGALVSKNDRYFLYHDVNIVGRSEKAFLCLQDPLISRKHCIISKSEDKTFTICDMSSSGTYVNSKKLVKNRVQTLNHKDTISFGYQQKHVYVFVVNKKLNMSTDQSEYLNSQMKEKMLSLENSHSMELMRLNTELCKIDSDKFELQLEMNSRLQEQENLFKAEKLSLSNLVTMTQEQKDDAENKLKEMKEKFEAEEKKLKEEVESKYAIMVKKEEELQQLKIEMELQHQKDRKELEERCQAEIEELKAKLAFSELEQDRLQEETRNVQQQLAESKKILLESEIEQSRLAEEKDVVETKLIDLTKESTYKDDVVMDLKRQLEEKEKEEERIRKGVEKMEEHLMCSICVELFIEPTVLNCGHMFCKTCIEEWKTKKKMCPMCRAKITNCVEVYTLDSIIETHVALLSSEAKENREKIINDRKKVISHPPKKNKRRYTRTSSPYRRPSDADTTPRSMIPMVQINRDSPLFAMHLRRIGDLSETTGQSHNLPADPFTWNTHEDRMLPIARMEVDEPLEQIDLTNILEPTAPRRQSATVTSGLIDLTTP